MVQIRKNVFETNSSSTHSVVMCDEKTWEDFAAGKLYYNTMSRYDEYGLKKYPLDKYKYLPREETGLNELPIFCTFQQIKEYINHIRNRLVSTFDYRKQEDIPEKNRIKWTDWSLLIFSQTFYLIDELEGYKYNKDAGMAALDFYFG